MQITTQRVVIVTTWGDIVVTLKNSLVTECRLPRLENNPEQTLGIVGIQPQHISPEIEHFFVSLFSRRQCPPPPYAQPTGTPFQQKVWQAIATVPYGETRSYSQLAAMINHPNAVRAVGTACGKNPLPLLIPCHRILGTNHRSGGFSAGLPWKKALLQLENETTP